MKKNIENLIPIKDSNIPHSLLYRTLAHNKYNELLCLKVYNLFTLYLNKDMNDLHNFMRGYRSGMAQISRGSYNLPDVKNCTDLATRGYRFSWLCHSFARKNGLDEYPDLRLEVKHVKITNTRGKNRSRS